MMPEPLFPIEGRIAVPLNPVMEKDWALIASFGLAAIAELKKAVLETCGIPAIIVNKSDSSYHFGEVELYVKRDDVIRAKRILDEEEPA
jgi:hypothetical protein